MRKPPIRQIYLPQRYFYENQGHSSQFTLLEGLHFFASFELFLNRNSGLHLFTSTEQCQLFS